MNICDTVIVQNFQTHYSMQILLEICFLFTKYLVKWQTVPTLIRLLLKEQSDLGLHCLHMPFGKKSCCTKFLDLYAVFILEMRLLVWIQYVLY